LPWLSLARTQIDTKMLRRFRTTGEKGNRSRAPSGRSWRNLCANEERKELRISLRRPATQFSCVTCPNGAGASGELMTRYLFGFLCVCALGVVPLPRNASAQAAEHSEATEQAVDEEPSPEPAGEEGSPSLEYADPGSNPPNIKWGLDWSLHEDMDPAVRRARIGLITSAAVLAVGGALFGISYIDIGFTPRRWVDPVRITGVTLMAGGAAGMIATGALLGVRKRKLRELQAAHYARRRRVQWDLARSRLVF